MGRIVYNYYDPQDLSKEENIISGVSTSAFQSRILPEIGRVRNLSRCSKQSFHVLISLEKQEGRPVPDSMIEGLLSR